MNEAVGMIFAGLFTGALYLGTALFIYRDAKKRQARTVWCVVGLLLGPLGLLVWLVARPHREDDGHAAVSDAAPNPVVCWLSDNALRLSLFLSVLLFLLIYGSALIGAGMSWRTNQVAGFLLSTMLAPFWGVMSARGTMRKLSCRLELRRLAAVGAALLSTGVAGIFGVMISNPSAVTTTNYEYSPQENVILGCAIAVGMAGAILATLRWEENDAG